MNKTIRLWIAGLGLLMIASAAFYAAITRARGNGGAATVCGSIVAVRQADDLRGAPVFLTLGHAYAGHDLTVVLLGKSRTSFGSPPTLSGHHLCVSGRVQSFLNKPRMVVGAPAE